MRGLTSILTSFLLAFAALGSMPTTALAECPRGLDFPPATTAARTAREVIVGTVVENVEGSWQDFRLRIDHVLRGPARVGEVRRFRLLYAGWPFFTLSTGEKVPPCSPIPGWKGNVIALSLDALAPDGETRYNGGSWLSGELPYDFDVPRTTLAEMRAAVAAPRTDAAGPHLGPHAVPTGIVIPVIAGLIAAMYVLGDGRRGPGQDSQTRYRFVSGDCRRRAD